MLLLSLFTLSSYDVKAEGLVASNVLEDLEKDREFDINDYPSKEVTSLDDLDTMANIITIAEGTDNQLFIYVYQPYYNAYEFKLDSISMSNEKSLNGNYSEGSIKSYDLEFCNSYKTLYKYELKNYKVNVDEQYRYYGLIAIWRPFIQGLDTKVEGAVDQKVSLSVGQQWCVYTINGGLQYEMATFNTVEITPIFTGTFEFSNGLNWGGILGSFKWGNSHFICFNVDNYIVKHIYDADLTCKVRDVTETWATFVGTEYFYGEYEEKYITLTDIDKVSYTGTGLWGFEYSCNRIMSSSDFIKNYQGQGVLVDSEVEAKIKSSQWVFSFLETEKSSVNYSGGYSNYYSECADVTILRLHFLDINNNIYNLGAVMDKTTADNIPDGTGSANPDLSGIWEVLRWVLLVIGVIAVVAILAIFFPIFSIILKGLIFILKFIFNIITLPFRLIGKLINKIKERKRKKEDYKYLM